MQDHPSVCHVVVVVVAVVVVVVAVFFFLKHGKPRPYHFVRAGFKGAKLMEMNEQQRLLFTGRFFLPKSGCYATSFFLEIPRFNSQIFVVFCLEE